MKTIIYIFCFLFTCNLALCQVGINSSSPDSSAVLDLNSNSNNQGLLVPRLSMDQIVAISNPAEGLLVYCTNLDIFCFFAEGEWTSLRPWKQDADLSTNQNIIANLPNGGNVGVGVDNPFSQLTVNGNTAVGANPDPITNPSYAPPANSLFVQNRLIVANNITDSINVANPYAIQAAGNIDARNGKIKESGHDLIPYGVIVLWHGASNNIPEGWALCDGSNGTPNLSGRFVMGAGSRQMVKYDGSSYNYYGSSVTFSPDNSPNVNHGADLVQLTVGEMPAHNHDNSTSPNGRTGTDTHKHSWNWQNNQKDFDTDGSGTHDNRITLGDQPDVTFTESDITSFNSIMYDRMNNNTHSHQIYPRGGNQAHENRPPYYVLCYIMKL